MTVRFDLNGKEGEAPEVQVIGDDKRAVRPTDPTAEGFEFVGWYMDKECTQIFHFDSAVVRAMQLQYKNPGKYLSKPYVMFDNVLLKSSDYT